MLTNSTIYALVALVRDLHERLVVNESYGGYCVPGEAQYGDTINGHGKAHTVRAEVRNLFEATSHIQLKR